MRLVGLLLVVACTRDVDLAREAVAPDAGEDVVDAGADAAGIDAGVDAAGIDAAVPTGCATDPCRALSRLTERPLLDGVADCVGEGASLPAELWNDVDPFPPGVDSVLRAAWHPDGLYLFLEVTDPTVRPSTTSGAPWCGDALHAFVDDDGVFPGDASYDDPGTAQLIVTAPSADGTFEGTRWDPSSARGAWPSSDFVAVRTASGWAVEVFLPRERLGRYVPWAVGERLAWNVFVSLSGDATSSTEDPVCRGARLGDYGMFDVREADRRLTPHASTRAFCSAALEP
ncbi:MAG: hypothetical protein H6721_31470 [Sandaracinus sp.]|nr:hypothetical protein [Sandaracinus sp.]